MSVVPCLTWVRRGKAKHNPTKVQIDKEDLKRIIEDTEERLAEQDGASDDEDVLDDIENKEVPANTEDSEVAAARAFAKSIKGRKGAEKGPEEEVTVEDDPDDIDKKYNLDGYDEEESDVANPLKGIGNLTLYASNDDDPYITLKDEDDSDAEDFEIKPTDNLLLIGRAAEEYCSLEIHVYNEASSDFYVHHDILLPSFPLALEWMDYDMSDESQGNFVAIATMEPTIDIWDLDVVDNLEPLATLGQRVKKKKKGKVLGHTDAVLDLSWNKHARHVLASASSDHTVGLWDLSEGKMAMSVAQHTDKVQCVKWHPAEEHMLLSGSFDKTVKMYDCRAPDTNNKTWQMNGEVEKLLWNHHSPWHFFASTDTGHIFYMDSRQDQPIYTISAHTEAVTGLCLSSEDPSLLITSSTDQVVKVWDITDNKPSVVLSRNIKMGQIYCGENCPDSAFLFAFGGKRNIKVWDIRDSADVAKHFCSGIKPAASVVKQSVAPVESTVSMETEASGVTMETDTTQSSQSSEAKQKYKKKLKKKKQKKNAF